MRRRPDDEVAEVELLLRVENAKKRFIGVSTDSDELDKDPIWLPMGEIDVKETGRFEAGLPIIKVAMDQSLAERKGLV